jgi:hypothetical protein
MCLPMGLEGRASMGRKSRIKTGKESSPAVDICTDDNNGRSVVSYHPKVSSFGSWLASKVNACLGEHLGRCALRLARLGIAACKRPRPVTF